METIKGNFGFNIELADWCYLLDVVNSVKTMDEIEAGAYMCPNTKYYRHARAGFLGSYRLKTVPSVHQIDALVACSPGGKAFELRWKNKNQAEAALIARAKAMLGKLNDIHVRVLADDGLQIFLLGEGAPTDFIKDSYGGLRGSRIYFRDIAKKLKANSVSDLATKLKGRTWSEFGH